MVTTLSLNSWCNRLLRLLSHNHPNTEGYGYLTVVFSPLHLSGILSKYQGKINRKLYFKRDFMSLDTAQVYISKQLGFFSITSIKSASEPSHWMFYEVCSARTPMMITAKMETKKKNLISCSTVLLPPWWDPAELLYLPKIISCLATNGNSSARTGSGEWKWRREILTGA